MRTFLLALVLAGALPGPVWAQGAAEPYLRELLAERGTFDVARTEAAIARRHTKAALRETDLAAMKSEVAAAVNAIDPTLVTRGPGLGTGLRAALVASVDRILAAQRAESSNEDLTLRASAASVAGQTALMRTDEVLEEARAALAATSTSQAIPSLVRMDDLIGRVTDGFDTNGDGDIAWSQGEGGIQQAWSFTREIAIIEGMQLAEGR